MISPDEVIWAFRMILGREPESDIVIANHCKLADRTALRTALLNSKEFARRLPPAAMREKHFTFSRQTYPDYNRTYDLPAWVFIHIEKTAGTSLQNMLIESFDRSAVFSEHDDTLQWRSAAELSQYALFSGHFNYDSLFLIPRRHLNVFTFVADPQDRLVSLYKFWRAHRPSSPNFHPLMQRAADLDMEAFFKHEVVRKSTAVFNHMTYCLLGRRQWLSWRSLLSDARGPERRNAFRSISAQVKQHLNRLAFIGLKEQFDQSCDLLFQRLNRPRPPTRHDHSLHALATKDPNIILVPDSAIPTDFPEIIRPLIEIDAVIYREAQRQFTEVSGPSFREQVDSRKSCSDGRR